MISCPVESVILRKGTDPGDPYTYQIERVETKDTGLYSCVAGNILGETSYQGYNQQIYTENVIMMVTVMMLMMMLLMPITSWTLKKSNVEYNIYILVLVGGGMAGIIRSRAL